MFGDCSTLLNGMAYDVPGGGPPGLDLRRREHLDGARSAAASSSRTPTSTAAASTTCSRAETCGRGSSRRRVYHGRPNHIYNTIRPILHEPGPIGNGSYATVRGIPIAEGEVLRRAAVHENHNLHVAAMGFWVAMLVPDASVERCGPLPDDIVELNRPRRFDRTPNYGLVVPQLSRPTGAFRPFTGGSLDVDDGYFTPGRVTANVGETVTWRFVGRAPHSVTVANGPRGFSSLYLGRTAAATVSRRRCPAPTGSPA